MLTAAIAWLTVPLLLAPGPVSATTVDEREVAVFEALLNHGLGPDTPLLVIAQDTTGDPAAIAVHADAAALVAELGLPAAVLADWSRRNANVVNIEQALRLDASYRLLAPDDRAKLFEAADPQAAWSQFFGRYQGAPGLLRLSRVGFDERFEHALVYVEHHCGVTCGAGRLVHLERGADAAWHVAGASLVWMVDDLPTPAPTPLPAE